MTRPIEPYEAIQHGRIHLKQNDMAAAQALTGNEQLTAHRRFIDIAGLASELGVPKTWIYDRTARSSNDRIPHLKLGKYIRFDIQSNEFVQWLNRNFRS